MQNSCMDGLSSIFMEYICTAYLFIILDMTVITVYNNKLYQIYYAVPKYLKFEKQSEIVSIKLAKG